MIADNVELYWVTHPYAPNTSGNARGRVLHIKRNDKKFEFKASYCGMKLVEKADDWSRGNRRICIPCVQLHNSETTTHG